MYFITILMNHWLKVMRVIVHFLSMLVVEMNDLSSLIDYVTMKTTKNLQSAITASETMRLLL